MKKALLLVFIGLLICRSSEAQEKTAPAEAYDFLKIVGIVVDDNDRLEDVTIRLFKANQKVDSAYTAKTGKFEFILDKDCFYALEFEKYGYEKTVVGVNTHRYNVDTENEDNSYEVGFEVELIEEIKAKTADKITYEDRDIFDFPRVLIGYKGGEEEGFFNDSKYLKYVKSEIKRIKDLAKK